MDINELITADAHGEGAEMCVKDQFGNDTDFYIRLAGIDSELWQKAVAARRRRLMAMSEDELEIGNAELIADVTIGWRGLKKGDDDIEFSREAALGLYRGAPYILRQADAFVATRANFTKA